MKIKYLRAAVRLLGVAASLAIGIWNYMPPMRALKALPQMVRVREGDDAFGVLETASGGPVRISGSIPVASQSDERLHSRADYSCSYMLFGRIPLKTVQVLHDKNLYFVPGGQAVGITIRTEGVLIVGLGAVDTESGALSPGTAAGLKPGDVIMAADGEAVMDSAHLSALCERSGGRVRLSLLRGEETVSAEVQLVKDAAGGGWRLGVWARDSTAGVGTLSFYDAESGWFAALGHPVSDVDTQSLLTVRDGRILRTSIVDVQKGETGSPGELIGVFSIYDKPLGLIERNTEYGICGKLSDMQTFDTREMLEMGYAHEARTGAAQMIATVSEAGPEIFQCEIIRVSSQSGAATKGMVVRITDERLLQATGGIVQGMSGCPVIQDGKLLGIVTHVFVNDPTRGYCIYAEWMLDQMSRDP